VEYFTAVTTQSGFLVLLVTMIKTYGLTHIALCVKNAEASSRFYREVFGVQEMYRKDGFGSMV
jgi:catechol-2,3-dioxygenase